MPVRTSRSMRAAMSGARNGQQNRASIRAGLWSSTGAAPQSSPDRGPVLLPVPGPTHRCPHRTRGPRRHATGRPRQDQALPRVPELHRPVDRTDPGDLQHRHPPPASPRRRPREDLPPRTHGPTGAGPRPHGAHAQRLHATHVITEISRARCAERQPGVSVSSKYEFIDAEKALYPIVKMCEWMAVSTSGFYEWRGRPSPATNSRRAELRLLIGKVFADSDDTYGYRRVQAELARLGVPVGPELVRTLMRELDLVRREVRP